MTILSTRVLLFITLLSGGLLPTVSLAACADYELPVQQAVHSKDFNTLEQLLSTLNRQSDCPLSYLEAVKRSMAQIAAREADDLMQQDQLVEAKKWLKRAPTMIWETQVVHGNLVAFHQQWLLAAQFFNQALDLIDDPQATPQAPTNDEIEKIYQLAQEAQLLTGGLGDTIDDSGNARGMMRGSVRGHGPKRRLIPILFKSGGKVTSKGKKSVRRLAKHLIKLGQRGRVALVTLVGHSDRKGSRAACNRVSKRRAKVVEKLLRKAGVKKNTKISTIGKGKTEPIKFINPWKLTPKQKDQINRRVEFKIKYK
jgi:outer membrane protein OmpA-like peptidoglycan-associated protein